MPNYHRRFTKDEFKEELIKHLRDAPPGLLRSPQRLAAHAERKAGHYDAALAALDDAVARVRQIAATHPDPQARQDAEAAVQKISTAINTYGEASMDQNSTWDGGG